MNSPKRTLLRTDIILGGIFSQTTLNSFKKAVMNIYGWVWIGWFLIKLFYVFVDKLIGPSEIEL